MQKLILFCMLFLLRSALFSGIETFYHKIPTEHLYLGIRNVDHIYLINLAQRPERWQSCMEKLAPYDIYPQRVAGIYGWDLSHEALNQMGTRFNFGMRTGREPVFYYPLNGSEPEFCKLDGACYGNTYFSIWTSKGAVGCALSHLSTLNHAAQEGYETIWMMEDDISIVEDPRTLSDFIDKLDRLVGRDGWDMLFTDNLTLTGIDPNRDLLTQLPMMWRPDLPFFDLRCMLEKVDIGDDFIKIGSRTRFHSVIYRRSGIRKILNYYKERNMFMPIDHEFFFVPDLKAFVIKRPIVSVDEITSDTRMRHFQCNRND
jgi:GR25 family glycosyltransferase involved in LPS biosynthesis